MNVGTLGENPADLQNTGGSSIGKRVGDDQLATTDDDIERAIEVVEEIQAKLSQTTEKAKVPIKDNKENEYCNLLDILDQRRLSD